MTVERLAMPSSPRHRRLVPALAALVLLVVLVPFAAAWLAVHDDIVQAKDDIVAAETSIARQPQLQDELAALRRQAQSAPGLLSAATPALAQAELADQMKTIVDANSGVLMSAQMLPAERRNRFDQVAIAYDLTLPLSRLKSFLYAIETHTPYLFIDDVEMRMPPNWRPDTPQVPDPVLEIRCSVHAFRWRAPS